MKKCPNCKKIFGDSLNYCAFDGQLLELVTGGDFAVQDVYDLRCECKNHVEEGEFVPKCPTCGSPDVEPIKGMAWGRYDKNYLKSYKCNNCEHRW